MNANTHTVRTAMALLVCGFVCSDGVVLCADTEYTFGNTKYYAPKLWVKSEVADPAVAICGAGYANSIDRVHTELFKRVVAGMTTDGVRDAFAEVLSDFYAISIDPVPTPPMLSKFHVRYLPALASHV